jgi:hypothetical protein
MVSNTSQLLFPLPSPMVIQAGLCFNLRSLMSIVFTAKAVLISVRSGIYLAVRPIEKPNGVCLILAAEFIALVFDNTALRNRTSMSSEICFITGFLLLLFQVNCPTYLWRFVTSKII